MEFQYRASDDERRRRSRSRSPSLLAPSAPIGASEDDKTILTSAYTDRGGGLRSPPPHLVSFSGRDPRVARIPADPADDADEEEARRRQREKARIRDRILREETLGRFDLELEVRLELVERFRQRALPRAGGEADHQTQAAPAVAADISSSPFVPKENSIADARAASHAKRKSPAVGAGFTASKDISNKNQKLSLTCTVCGITANAEKTMLEHLNGKIHKRKAAALAARPITNDKESDDQGAEEEVAVVPAPPERFDDNFKATKFTMVTDAGMLNEVTQMDGYLLCEVCNVRTADRVAMMCHFQGTKHISKAEKVHQQFTGGSVKKGLEEHAAPATMMTPKHTVKSSIFAPANGGKEVAANGQARETPGVNETVSHIMEAPLGSPMEEKAGGGISERQGNIATHAEKYVVEVESSKASPAATNGVGDSAGVMEVGGVRHPVQRVKGTIICPCCNIKATSEIVMRSHLTGKKHKNKMTSSTAPALPMATKADDIAGASAAVVAQTMELDAPTDQAQAILAATEPAANDGITELAGKPVPVCADGEMFTVLRHEDGRFSCEPCGVRGCNKEAMIKHLYTKDALGQSTCRGKE